MSKLSVALNALGIHNDHNLVSRFGTPKKDVFINYFSPERARCGGAQVISPSHQTRPNEHWRDYGRMTFTGRRTDSLAEAVEWASKTYGITEWSASPFGPNAKVPTYILNAAKAALKGT